MMIELAEQYPQYGFAGNKGYGSREHMQAIAEFGATKWHRRSYEPIKSMHLSPAEQEGNRLFFAGVREVTEARQRLGEKR